MFLVPTPWGPWGGTNRPNIIKISITQSISKSFKPNFVSLLTNERYKTYQTGFLFRRLGHAPGMGLWGTVGVRGPIFFTQIQPDLVCELLTWMAHATAHLFWFSPPGALGRGQKVKYHQISITKSISKIFKQNCVCLLTNERYKTYKMGLSFGPLDHACPRVWDLGVLGVKI